MNRNYFRRLPLIAFGSLALLLTAACGSAATPASEGPSAAVETTAAPTQEVVIKATNFKFDKKEYTVKKGDALRIKLESDGIHGIRVSNTSVQMKPGDEKVYSFSMAGEYQIECSIPCGNGHERMKAVLKVV
ncbi:cytochrome C oxidase subunit II [Paenibacillus pasadenensis]|uniref:cytochrome C oxidase subunit II n=1 Tax=Paenibacillus pasadenensis TaxID=217090 RepID=UPI00203A812A|nr:cytochrome C oxidase subunit II [Paenibacillus pasadenensis]MCM3746806.1 cytochrome C oxidase subunit II [Paenibacillus pasadenensis]